MQRSDLQKQKAMPFLTPLLSEMRLAPEFPIDESPRLGGGPAHIGQWAKWDPIVMG